MQLMNAAVKEYWSKLGKLAEVSASPTELSDHHYPISTYDEKS
jgi:hypothetical protein